jgi:hypothetical protein
VDCRDCLAAFETIRESPTHMRLGPDQIAGAGTIAPAATR